MFSKSLPQIDVVCNARIGMSGYLGNDVNITVHHGAVIFAKCMNLPSGEVDDRVVLLDDFPLDGKFP